MDRINYNLDNEDKQSRRPIILFSAYRFSLEIKNRKIALINDKSKRTAMNNFVQTILYILM